MQSIRKAQLSSVHVGEPDPKRSFCLYESRRHAYRLRQAAVLDCLDSRLLRAHRCAIKEKERLLRGPYVGDSVRLFLGNLPI